MKQVIKHFRHSNPFNNIIKVLSTIFFGTVTTSVYSPVLFAQEYPDADQIKSITANWVCKWCPYSDKGNSGGSVTAGAGYVSNDSFKHGDYTGLNEKGPYAIAAAQYDRRSAQGNGIRAQADNLGLDSRSAKLEGGKQGWLYGKVNYQRLPKLNLDTARTPYTGDSDFSLPAGWTAGTDTQSMPQLAGALHNEDIYTKRDIVSLQGVYHQNASLSYQLAFERNSKEGKRTAGLALGNSFATARSVILPIPVDYVTNQGEVKVNYKRAAWKAALAYQFSKFDNGKHSVRWDNAYSSPAGASQGQAALEPDNTMQKVTANASYQITPSIDSSALLSVGRMEQDDPFLPYTVNSSLSPAALPAESLNGKINTFDTAVNVYTKITRQLRIAAKFLQNEQDNNTERHTYSYVTADTSLNATARANLPYSFRKQQYQVLGQYQITHHEFALGAQQTVFDRTYQEVDTTTENVVNGMYTTDIVSAVNLKIRGERSQRNGDSYNTVSEIQPAENPLLRKYNLADRKRDQLGVSLTYDPGTKLDAGIYVDASKDDYSHSDLGLLESIQKDYSVALGYRFNPALAFDADYSITAIESTQAGSQNFSTATWYAKNKDRMDAAHVAIHYQWIPKVFKLALEYEYAKSAGTIKVSTAEDFPVLRTERHTILLSGNYQYSERSTLIAFYRYEHYDENDWAVDGVYANTIPNVLSLGEVSPSYNIGVIGVALKYAF